METKFIGLEGFNEIESLPTKKRRVCRRELTTAQKTVRFVKRATTFCAKSVVRMSKNTAAKLTQTIENRKGSLKSVTIKAGNLSKKAKTQSIQRIKKRHNKECRRDCIGTFVQKRKAVCTPCTVGNPFAEVAQKKGCACSSSLFQCNHTFMCNGCKCT